MAVLQMQRVSICALKKDRKAILEKIQSMGIMEINQIIEDDEDFERMDTMNARQGFERSTQTADHALDVLSQYAPEKKSLFAGLEGKKLVGQEQFQKTVSRKKEIMRDAKILLDFSKEIAESKAGILKLENQIESLKPWMALDVPMNFGGTAKTAMMLGTMAAGTTQETVYSLIAAHAPAIEAVNVEVIASDKDAAYFRGRFKSRGLCKTDPAYG